MVSVAISGYCCETCIVKVKWDNLSRKVDVAQGIRQGAKLSTMLYKRYKDLVRINPTKTDLVPLTRKATNFELNMGANSIEQTNETKHLGLMRNSDNKIKVDENTSRKKNDICSTRPWVTCSTRNVSNHLIQDLENLCDPTYFVWCRSPESHTY